MTEYKAPELEVIMFACEDVINTSGYDGKIGRAHV